MSLTVFIMYFVEKDSLKNYYEVKDPNGSQDPDMSDSKSLTGSGDTEKSTLEGIKFWFQEGFNSRSTEF